MGTEVLRTLRSPFGLRAAFVRSTNPSVGRTVRELGLGPFDVELSPTERASVALRGCDVVVSFASPAADLAVLPAAAERGIPAVVGTTAHTADDRERLRAYAQRTAIVLAPNFSTGVGVLPDLISGLRPLAGNFDPTIVEAHHAAKVDRPSGTSLMLAAAVRAALSPPAGGVPPGPGIDVPVQSVRAGGIPGEHTLLFAGAHEELQIVHRVHSRRAFAEGALRAAGWVSSGRPPGLYEFRDVLRPEEARA